MSEPDMPTAVPYGDAAVLVSYGEHIDPSTNRRVHALAEAIRALRAHDARFGSPVPAYASVLVPIDPLELAPDEAVTRLAALAATIADPGEDPESPIVEIPVRYGGPDGPDLDEVAERATLRPADVVELHAGTIYRVYMLGFVPGFAYLGTVPAVIAAPRRTTPRPRVPSGSVAIAGKQTGVYPFETPGGWNLIGRTDLVAWDPRREPPALLAPGMRVRFRPVPG
jgi:KipI family sensor histidine kinase inhibitor